MLLRCAVSLLALGFCTSGAMAGCALVPLAVDEAAPGDTSRYVGRTAALEIEFRNEKRQGAVEAFPDSPLTIRRRASGAECAVEGGVWARNGVFVSASQEVVAVHVFSGSSDTLDFYAARSCKALGSIDVSGAQWSVHGGEILIAAPTGARGSSRTVQLDAACRPRRRGS